MHMLLFIRSNCHEMILLTTSSVLTLIIYACRNIPGGIVTNILGHLRHTIFVAACSQLGIYIHSSHIHITIASYNLCTTFFHFRLVQEVEQKALIPLLDMVWTTISYSQDFKIAIFYNQLATQVAMQLTYSYSYKIVIITVYLK